MPLATSSAAPTLDDARRAAEAVAGAGASQVLLFGSLARGRQAPGSDIDLVAIFDDLDYPTRWARKSELQRLAGEAAGCDVDVRVTDWPEWAVRSKVVTTSFESRIAQDAVVLWSGEPRGVNWDTEIGLPATNEEEAAASLTNVGEALTNISGQLHPHPDEQTALDETDPEEYVASNALIRAAHDPVASMKGGCARRRISRNRSFWPGTVVPGHAEVSRCAPRRAACPPGVSPPMPGCERKP